VFKSTVCVCTVLVEVEDGLPNSFFKSSRVVPLFSSRVILLNWSNVIPVSFFEDALELLFELFPDEEPPPEHPTAVVDNKIVINPKTTLRFFILNLLL